MAVRFKIEGHDAIKLKLDEYRQRGQSCRAVVGYVAPYAVYVHENLMMGHRVGQAKYLEQPARMYRKDISNIIQFEMSKRAFGSLAGAVLKGAEFLLRMSQPLVPVDTGRLQRSGYATVEITKTK